MSQSKSGYGVSTPKGTEQEYCQTQTSAEGNPPIPDCWRRRVAEWDWHETAFSAAYAGMHDPCPDCFDISPDPEEVETVIRSCSYPTTYHKVGRPHDETEAAKASTTGNQAATDTDAGERVECITELKKGDGVLWHGRSTPMRVIEATTDPRGSGRLRGPDGGEYSIEGRPSQTPAIAIYPGIGTGADIYRIKLSDSPHPESEAV